MPLRATTTRCVLRSSEPEDSVRHFPLFADPSSHASSTPTRLSAPITPTLSTNNSPSTPWTSGALRGGRRTFTSAASSSEQMPSTRKPTMSPRVTTSTAGARKPPSGPWKRVEGSRGCTRTKSRQTTFKGPSLVSVLSGASGSPIEQLVTDTLTSVRQTGIRSAAGRPRATPSSAQSTAPVPSASSSSPAKPKLSSSVLPTLSIPTSAASSPPTVATLKRT